MLLPLSQMFSQMIIHKMDTRASGAKFMKTNVSLGPKSRSFEQEISKGMYVRLL